MSAALFLLALTAPQTARLLAVRQEVVDGRVSITIVGIGPMEDSSVRREGDELVVTIPAEAPPGFTVPQPTPPVEAMSLAKAGTGLELRVRVPNEPYELKSDGSRLRLLLGAQAQAAAIAPDVRTLYKRLFPASTPGEGLSEAGALLPVDQPSGKEGLAFGPLALRPSVVGSYVDADAAFLSTNQPVDEHYFETRPRLDLEAPVGSGSLQAGYEARIRSDASLPILRTTSHDADATLDLPVAGQGSFRVTEHFFRGSLETSEVDPGAEFFFGLNEFRRNDLEGRLRVQAGSRLYVDLGGSWNDVHMDQPSNFFSYDQYGASASLGLELGPNLRFAADYAYFDIPFNAARPEAESHAHSGGLSLRGELTPLTKIDLSVGYRDERDPLAGPGGQKYQGVVYAAMLTRDLRPGSALSVSGSRTTLPSGFEANGFYVTNSVEVGLSLQAPFRVALRGALGYRWNDYELLAQDATVPRHDDILGFAVGIGRPLTRWAFLRADYSKQRRDSNLAAFSTTTHSFTAQVGIGYLGGGQ
jgi:hypothetical protein